MLTIRPLGPAAPGTAPSRGPRPALPAWRRPDWCRSRAGSRRGAGSMQDPARRRRRCSPGRQDGSPQDGSRSRPQRGPGSRRPSHPPAPARQARRRPPSGRGRRPPCARSGRSARRPSPAARRRPVRCRSTRPSPPPVRSRSCSFTAAIIVGGRGRLGARAHQSADTFRALAVLRHPQARRISNRTEPSGSPFQDTTASFTITSGPVR